MTSPTYTGRSFVCDLETNGLLATVDRVHCAVAIDIDTDEVLDFKPNEIGEFLKLYQEAELIIGHNWIGYDAQVLEKIYGVTRPVYENGQLQVIDTLNLARLVFSDIQRSDFEVAGRWKKWKSAADRHGEGYPTPEPKKFPGQLCGSHSLEAWGYRLGATMKGDYAKRMKEQGIDPWAAWNEDMHQYMLDDGKLNLELYRYLESHLPSAQSVTLEMRVQALCTKIERNGWPFDEKAARELYLSLCEERDALSTSLRSLFPPWEVQLPDFIPARDNKTKGYKKGVPVPRSEIVEFNPASRDHIADRLINKYGWDPQEYTASGKAKVDDDVLQSLPYPEAHQLARYFLIQKRIGQLGEGNKAWLKIVKNGKIHGRYNTNGAATGRATHIDPNIAQVPGVQAEFGKECRSLFTVLPGFVQIGADQAGLELRALASFLAPFDNGAYAKTVIEGDVHWENAKALFALPAGTVRDDSNPDHKLYRTVAKTFIYAFLYGAGDEKLGAVAGVTDEEAAVWQSSEKHYGAVLKQREKYIKIHAIAPAKQQLRHIYKGALLRSRFLKAFPELKELGASVKADAKQGWLKGLDGRVLPVRSEHSALNTLLQSAGALICKQWIVDAEDALLMAGLEHGWDRDFAVLGWIHDELQIAVREGLEEQVSAILVAQARAAADAFDTWRCPTDGDVKTGRNWAECH